MTADRDLADPRLAALLREHSAEAPGAHVDATILAAAHRAVDSAPFEANRPPSGANPSASTARTDTNRALARQPWRWWMPLAAAAVVGVVVIGMLPLAPTIPGDAPAVVADDAAVSRPDASAERERDTSGAARSEFADAPAQRNANPAVKSERAQAQPAPPVVQKKQDTTSTPLKQQAPPPAAAPPRDQVAAAQGALAARQAPMSRQAIAGLARERNAGDARSRDPTEWIRHIRALRDDGHEQEALAELTRFRAAFDNADTRLPADLRAWAESLR